MGLDGETWARDGWTVESEDGEVPIADVGWPDAPRMAVGPSESS